MAALDDHSPDEIFCNSDVFDIDFHPAADIVALGTISGVVQVYVPLLATRQMGSQCRCQWHGVPVANRLVTDSCNSH